MRFLTISLLALGTLLTFTSAKHETPKLSRIKPDMEEIRRSTCDPASRMYYPKLYRQFKSNDTTMTLDQMRHLYLGYIYQEDYNPYRQSPYSSRVEELYLRDKHTHAECDTIIRYAEKSLNDDPYDLRQMSFLIYAYREKKKNNMAAILQWKLNHLLEAIISTGTGLDTANAWVVNNPQHEYNLLNFQDYIVDSQEDVPPYYDYITVKPNAAKDEPKGFYFNILYLLEQYNKKFPDEL